MNVPAEVRWDHPRGCGENFLLEPFRRINLGITPADAGKTLMDLLYTLSK